MRRLLDWLDDHPFLYGLVTWLPLLLLWELVRCLVTDR